MLTQALKFGKVANTQIYKLKGIHDVLTTD